MRMKEESEKAGLKLNIQKTKITGSGPMVLSHFSGVQLFATPWTTACQSFPSVGFYRQEYWSGLSCPAGIEPTSLQSPALAGGFFTTSATLMQIEGEKGNSNKLYFLGLQNHCEQ